MKILSEVAPHLYNLIKKLSKNRFNYLNLLDIKLFLCHNFIKNQPFRRILWHSKKWITASVSLRDLCITPYFWSKILIIFGFNLYKFDLSYCIYLTLPSFCAIFFLIIHYFWRIIWDTKKWIEI